MIPVNEFIQFGIVFKTWLSVLDKFFLNAAFVSQIHVQVNHGGLDIFVSQADFDIGNGFAARKHIYGPRVTEAVRRMKGFKAFGRQGATKIFLAQPVDARTR